MDKMREIILRGEYLNFINKLFIVVVIMKVAYKVKFIPMDQYGFIKWKVQYNQGSKRIFFLGLIRMSRWAAGIIPLYVHTYYDSIQHTIVS